MSQEPIIVKGMHVFAAINIRQTIIQREARKITHDDLILEPCVLFAESLNIAEHMLMIMNLTPDCEIVFYLHLPEAKEYRPLIRSVTDKHESFPWYRQN